VSGGVTKSSTRVGILYIILHPPATFSTHPPEQTTTLLEYCSFALSLLPPGEQLLAVAASNVAVDQLVAGLLQRGVKVVRIGQPVKVSWWQPVMIEKRFQYSGQKNLQNMK
jgi:hypothetical protein